MAKLGHWNNNAGVSELSLSNAHRTARNEFTAGFLRIKHDFVRGRQRYNISNCKLDAIMCHFAHSKCNHYRAVAAQVARHGLYY